MPSKKNELKKKQQGKTKLKLNKMGRSEGKGTALKCLNIILKSRIFIMIMKKIKSEGRGQMIRFFKILRKMTEGGEWGKQWKDSDKIKERKWRDNVGITEVSEDKSKCNTSKSQQLDRKRYN